MSTLNLPFKTRPRNSNSDIPRPILKSVDFSTLVPQLVYTVDQSHEMRDSPSLLPIASQPPSQNLAQEQELNGLDKEFRLLDIAMLCLDIDTPYNSHIKTWYLNLFPKTERESLMRKHERCSTKPRKNIFLIALKFITQPNLVGFILLHHMHTWL